MVDKYFFVHLSQEVKSINAWHWKRNDAHQMLISMTVCTKRHEKGTIFEELRPMLLVAYRVVEIFPFPKATAMGYEMKEPAYDRLYFKMNEMVQESGQTFTSDLRSIKNCCQKTEMD